MNVVDTITFGNQSFPPGTALGNLVITVTGTASGNTTPIVQTAPAGTLVITVPVPIADTYNVSLQQQDGNGNALGAALTGSITTTGTVLSVPVSMVLSES